MKPLLAILLSFLLMEMPVFAIHGGYTLGGNGSIVGTYAGTLIPTSDTPENGNTSTFGSNDLGLFTLSVPSAGVASGTVLVFSQGRTFFGTLQGIQDASKDNGVKGVINAVYNYNLALPTTATNTDGNLVTTYTSLAVQAQAEGSFDATTTDVTNPNDTASATGVNLSGSATVDINQGFIEKDGSPNVTEEVTFEIDGFQQSIAVETQSLSLTGS